MVVSISTFSLNCCYGLCSKVGAYLGAAMTKHATFQPVDCSTQHPKAISTAPSVTNLCQLIPPTLLGGGRLLSSKLLMKLQLITLYKVLIMKKSLIDIFKSERL